jgi:ComEC/Rec2-related protein
VTIAVQTLDARNIAEKPDRVRLAIRKHTAPPVGSFVELKAHLSPPLQPLRPGGYDFARDMYAQQIGASGYALGKIKVVDAKSKPSFWVRYASVLDSTRAPIDRRIHAVLPGDRRAIASALITVTRDAITPPVNDAMYISSLAHVLSISGYHMAVVAGIVFFVVRGSLALVPPLATRRPIKKWAAGIALTAVFFYMLLSGSEVATQRSFVMIAIVLIGIMLDRPTLTFRTISIAALCVLVLSPQSVAHPSFQMSFAATLALIAAYQRGLPWKADADTSRGARIARWGVREVVGLILASTVAALATTPYTAFHFHRLAPYGVLANLFAMPVGLRAGDADGHPRRHRDSVRLRRTVLATDGPWDRLDDRRRDVGCAAAGRRRAHSRLRHRAAAARDWRCWCCICCAASCAGSERASGPPPRCGPCSRRRPIFIFRRMHRPQRCEARMAYSRCCIPRATVSRSRNGSPPMRTAATRKTRICMPACAAMQLDAPRHCTTAAGRDGALDGSLCRGLRAHGGRHQPARGVPSLRGGADRPQGRTDARRDRVALDGRGLRTDRGAAARL